MPIPDSQRGTAVIKLIKSDSVTSLSKDYLEIGIDSLIESAVLKDIPFVNTVVGLFNFGSSVRDQIFCSKFIRFITQLSELSAEDRISMAERLNHDDKFAGRAGAAIIEIIDRMESERKPELTAKCFAAYAKEEISFQELRRILMAIERIPSFDIERLREFHRTSDYSRTKSDESLLLSFVNAGLGQNNGGLSGGVIKPTKLCDLFLQLDLDK